MSGTRKRVAILISGRGSNMAALIEAAADPAFPAEIVGVISDQPDAPGLAFADARGIRASAIAAQPISPSKEAHDAGDRRRAARRSAPRSSASPATCGC